MANRARICSRCNLAEQLRAKKMSNVGRPASTLGAEIFREYELHIPDVVPRPQWLEHKIGETKHRE
uniref:Uncharacterized protein n=1 Tax=Oryza brachyantha TaxID=4533 RepID=J3LPR7_ORYBR